MNTPEPCDKCAFLYVDAMTKDSIDGFVDCKKGHDVGRNNCPDFQNYAAAKGE